VKIILFLLSYFAVTLNTYAYIDPGTTSSIFSVLAPVISFLLVILGFLFKPLMHLVRRFKPSLSKKDKKKK